MLCIYLALSSRSAAAAAEWADLSFWKQKVPAPKPSSLQGGRAAKTRFQPADGTKGSWKGPSLPGNHRSPCSDAWSQPAAGIRESKQQEPTAAKSGDSSTLQTDVFRLGGRQGGQPHTTDNLSDAARSLLRAGETFDICTCHSCDGPRMVGTAPPRSAPLPPELSPIISHWSRQKG